MKLNDLDAVDESMLKDTGAFGVFKKDGGVQVVYGPKVCVVASEFIEYLQGQGWSQQ